MKKDSMINRLMPAVTDRDKPLGGIRYYAQGGMTCYIIRGKNGDMLIDTGLFYIHSGLEKWLADYRIKHLFLTHAHADHDWNAARIQAKGVKIVLSERDKGLNRHYMTQPVKPTFPKYRFRNLTQWVNGSIFRSPEYKPDIYFTGSDSGLLKELGYPAEIVPLPGHTCGSAGLLSGKVLYCGDAFTALWKRPDITPHAVSIREMRSSLRRILEISPEWLACGHGLPLRFEEARPVIEDYLRKRG